MAQAHGDHLPPVRVACDTEPARRGSFTTDRTTAPADIEYEWNSLRLQLQLQAQALAVSKTNPPGAVSESATHAGRSGRGAVGYGADAKTRCGIGRAGPVAYPSDGDDGQRGAEGEGEDDLRCRHDEDDAASRARPSERAASSFDRPRNDGDRSPVCGKEPRPCRADTTPDASAPGDAGGGSREQLAIVLDKVVAAIDNLNARLIQLGAVQAESHRWLARVADGLHRTELRCDDDHRHLSGELRELREMRAAFDEALREERRALAERYDARMRLMEERLARSAEKKAPSERGGGGDGAHRKRPTRHRSPARRAELPHRTERDDALPSSWPLRGRGAFGSDTTDDNRDADGLDADNDGDSDNDGDDDVHYRSAYDNNDDTRHASERTGRSRRAPGTVTSSVLDRAQIAALRRRETCRVAVGTIARWGALTKSGWTCVRVCPASIPKGGEESLLLQRPRVAVSLPLLREVLLMRYPPAALHGRFGQQQLLDALRALGGYAPEGRGEGMALVARLGVRAYDRPSCERNAWAVFDLAQLAEMVALVRREHGAYGVLDLLGPPREIPSPAACDLPETTHMCTTGLSPGLAGDAIEDKPAWGRPWWRRLFEPELLELAVAMRPDRERALRAAWPCHIGEDWEPLPDDGEPCADRSASEAACRRVSLRRSSRRAAAACGAAPVIPSERDPPADRCDKEKLRDEDDRTHPQERGVVFSSVNRKRPDSARTSAREGSPDGGRKKRIRRCGVDG